MRLQCDQIHWSWKDDWIADSIQPNCFGRRSYFVRSDEGDVHFDVANALLRYAQSCYGVDFDDLGYDTPNLEILPWEIEFSELDRVAVSAEIIDEDGERFTTWKLEAAWDSLA